MGIHVDAAYRLLPVHPDDKPLLAIRWKGGVYIDTRLPFGLYSAPKIFMAITDSLERIIWLQGITLVEHYLDDYIFLSWPQDASSQRDLETFGSTCEELGVPLAGHKQEGPCTRLTHPGSKIDTIAGHLHLTPEKLDRLYKRAALPVEQQEGTHPKKVGISHRHTKPCMQTGEAGLSFLRKVMRIDSHSKM